MKYIKEEKEKKHVFKKLLLFIALFITLFLGFNSCKNNSLKAATSTQLVDLASYNINSNDNFILTLTFLNSDFTNDSNYPYFKVLEFDGGNSLELYTSNNTIFLRLIDRHDDVLETSTISDNITSFITNIYIIINNDLLDCEYYYIDNTGDVNFLFSDNADSYVYIYFVPATDNYENPCISYNLQFFDTNIYGYDDAITNYPSENLLNGFNRITYQMYYNYGYAQGMQASSQAAYDLGYSRGYDAGDSDGYDRGYRVGHQAGQTAGERIGYDLGYQAGHDDAIEEGFKDGYLTAYGATYNNTISALHDYNPAGLNTTMYFECFKPQENYYYQGLISIRAMRYDGIAAPFSGMNLSRVPDIAAYPNGAQPNPRIYCDTDNLVYIENDALYIGDNVVLTFESVSAYSDKYLYIGLAYDINYNYINVYWALVDNENYLIKNNSIDANYLLLSGDTGNHNELLNIITTMQFYSNLENIYTFTNNNGTYNISIGNDKVLANSGFIENVYNIGYDDGIHENIENTGALDWIWGIFACMQGFLDIKFGAVSVGAIISIPLSIMLLYAILKLMRGGGD